MKAWIYMFGVGLQVSGLMYTIAGLRSSSIVLFGESKLPPKRLLKLLRSRIMKFVHRKTPPVEAAMAGMMPLLHMKTEGTAIPPKPSGDSSDSEWRGYFQAQIDQLRQQADRDRRKAMEASQNISARLAKETTRRGEGYKRLEEALAGPKGRDLTRAWKGVMISLAGVVVASLAGIP